MKASEFCVKKIRRRRLARAPREYLQQWDAAKKSAHQGLDLDQEHRIPKLEYLVAMALMHKRDYAQAAEHMRRHLSLTKIPSEVAEGQSNYQK